MNKFPTKKELERVRKLLNKTNNASQPLPKNSTAVERAKYALCEKFIIYKNESGITQRELAKKIGTTETVTSRLLHYHISDFTTDRLVTYLSKVYPEVEVNVNIKAS